MVRKQPPDAERHEPGIYDSGGTRNGKPVLMAFDKNGEVEFAAGEDAYGALEMWLRARGVRLSSSNAAFFLIRGWLLCHIANGWLGAA